VKWMLGKSEFTLWQRDNLPWTDGGPPPIGQEALPPKETCVMTVVDFGVKVLPSLSGERRRSAMPG